MHFALPRPRRSRHPVTRAFSLLLSLVLVGVLLICGLFVAGIMLVGGVLALLTRQWQGRHTGNDRSVPHSTHRARTLEGEFVVIRRGRSTL